MFGGMGGMMEQTGQSQTTQASANSLLPCFGVSITVMVGVTVVGIACLAYCFLHLQVRMGAVQFQLSVQNASQQTANGVTAYESVSKTLTDEERKIINVLNSHNGKYLQKYIRNETGLSRLKTDRIIA
jgi:uncharacterized membrane protein